MKSLHKELFQLTWPIFIESVLFMLLGTADVLMLGAYSDNAVGSVGIVNQIISMFNIMFGIITSGTTIICVQYIGARKNKTDIQRLIGGSLIINTVFGFLISFIIFLFHAPILSAMNVEEAFWDYSKTYLLLVGGTLFIQAVLNTFTAALRSYGFTQICMYVTLIMNLINISCNYLFINGHFGAPRLGVLGAAISTTLSKTIGCILLGILVARRIFTGFSIRQMLPFPFKEIKSVLTLGTPAAGESIAYNASKLVITVILTYLGEIAVNTNAYMNSITMYIYVFAVAVGQGTAILVGRLVGEGRKEDAYHLCFWSFFRALIITISVSILVLIFSVPILKLFTSNEEIIALGIKVLAVDIFLEFGRCANVIIINCLRAAGDVRFPVYIGIMSMWGVSVLFGYIFGIVFHWGIIGVWLALGCDEVLRGIIMFIRWKKKIWYSKSLV